MAVESLDVDDEAEWDLVADEDDSGADDCEDELVYDVAKEVADAVGLLVRTLDAINVADRVL